MQLAEGVKAKMQSGEWKSLPEYEPYMHQLHSDLNTVIGDEFSIFDVTRKKTKVSW